MDIEAARAIFLTPMPVGIVTKEELQLQDENPNMKSIMRGFGLNVDRISATLEGNEQEYLGVDMEEAFGLANFDKPPLTIRV